MIKGLKEKGEMKIESKVLLTYPKRNSLEIYEGTFLLATIKFLQSIRKWQMNYFKGLCSSTEYRI